jgi:hypothetical protein
MVWSQKAPRLNKRIRSERKPNTLQKFLPDVSIPEPFNSGLLMIEVVWRMPKAYEETRK